MRPLRHSNRASTTIALVLLALTTGCYRVRSQLISTPSPPDELYRCVQLQLGRAGYAIVGADRASGWLHAQRRIDRFLRKTVRAEIYATVIEDDDGSGSHLQLTDNSHAEDDAERIRAECVAR